MKVFIPMLFVLMNNWKAWKCLTVKGEVKAAMCKGHAIVRSVRNPGTGNGLACWPHHDHACEKACWEVGLENVLLHTSEFSMMLMRSFYISPNVHLILICNNPPGHAALSLLRIPRWFVVYVTWAGPCLRTVIPTAVIDRTPRRSPTLHRQYFTYSSEDPEKYPGTLLPHFRMKQLKMRGKVTPGWLVRLSVWLLVWLRSWSWGHRIKPCIWLHAQCGACLGFPLPLPTFCPLLVL